jgi:hypothetical protein
MIGCQPNKKYQKVDILLASKQDREKLRTSNKLASLVGLKVTVADCTLAAKMATASYACQS